MTVEVLPNGVKCNIKCKYCYQDNLRKTNSYGPSYNKGLVFKKLKELNSQFAVFGGEPLLLPIDELEEYFQLGIQISGENGIQTNGTLITNEHIDLFKKYNVTVGFSIDGVGDLNKLRWKNNIDQTRRLTEVSINNLRLCIENDIRTSLIVTLHKYNFGDVEKQKRLLDWLLGLRDVGMNSCRLHFLETENKEIQEKYSLEEGVLISGLLLFAETFEKYSDFTVDIFQDIKNLLKGNDQSVTCIWKGCDVLNTKDVIAVMGNGELGNCGRTYKSGLLAGKAEDISYERYIALYQTPQDFGGCQGCQYWLFCKGNCPGDSIDLDFRNKTSHCNVWKQLFEYFEKKLLEEDEFVITKHSNISEIEEIYFNNLLKGRNLSIFTILNLFTSDVKGKVWQVPVLNENNR